MSLLPQFMIDDGCEVVVEESPRFNSKTYFAFRYRFFTIYASRRLMRDEDFARRWWAQCKAARDEFAEKMYRHDCPPT